VRRVLVRRVQVEDVDISALVVPVGDGGSTAHASPPRDVLGAAPAADQWCSVQTTVRLMPAVAVRLQCVRRWGEHCQHCTGCRLNRLRRHPCAGGDVSFWLARWRASLHGRVSFAGTLPPG